MASLIQRPDSPNWICCYTTADGRRKKVSTKQTDREKAMTVCLAYAHAEQLAKRGTMTEQAARKIIGEILERATGEGLSKLAAGQWLEEWMDGKRDTKADKTVDRYEQVIRDFVKSLGTRAGLPVQAVTTKDILTFRRGLTANGRRSNKTANNAVKVIRTALNAALRLGHITANPCAAVEDLDEQTAEREAFTLEQVQKLIAAAEGDWRRAIAFAYYTGARLGDTANIRWNMIDLAAGIVRFTPKKTKKKKIAVVVPLHPTLLHMLAERPGIGLAFVFPALAGRDTGGVKGLSRQFADIMDRAGIKAPIVKHTEGGRANTTLSFHSLRHSFTSELANAGVSKELRMKMTGHTKGETHATYTHHEIDVLRAAVEKMPGLG